MKDASHYITVLRVAPSLYLFPKLQSRARLIKVNMGVSMQNPQNSLKITTMDFAGLEKENKRVREQEREWKGKREIFFRPDAEKT